MKKAIIILILLAVVTGGVFLVTKMINPKAKGPQTTAHAPVIIGLSLGDTVVARWQTKDVPLFVERAKELNAEVVTTVVANYDADEQMNQIRNLISQGIKVIVVIASDSKKIAPVVAEAHAAGVKIIAYDRLILDSEPDMYVSFDNVKVGELEAQSVLGKAYKGNFAYVGGSPSDNNAFMFKQGSMSALDANIKRGDINLVINTLTDNWDPALSYKTIKDYLATGKKLDAVVAANDGLAYGVIKALEEKGLAGKIPVSGQDADLSACQRIIAGTQTSTVYKPIKAEAYKAAEIAVAMANDEKVVANNKANNGKIDVPSFLLDPILVNKDNMMSTVIKDGFQPFNIIYNPPAK